MSKKAVLKHIKDGYLIYDDEKRVVEVPSELLKRPDTIRKSPTKNDDELNVNSVDLDGKVVSTIVKNGTTYNTILFDDDELQNLSSFKSAIFKPENKQVAKLK